MNRRAFIVSTLAASTFRPLIAADAASGAELAHTEIWRRFIDKYGIMIDYAKLHYSQFFWSVMAWERPWHHKR